MQFLSDCYLNTKWNDLIKIVSIKDNYIYYICLDKDCITRDYSYIYDIEDWEKITPHQFKDAYLAVMKDFQEDYIKALPVKIGDKIMDEDGRVGQLSRIVPYRSPSERFMCATLSLTLFFHMEKRWYL